MRRDHVNVQRPAKHQLRRFFSMARIRLMKATRIGAAESARLVWPRIGRIACLNVLSDMPASRQPRLSLNSEPREASRK